ncbi:HIT family protein [Acinetobacter sp. B5B]|uniref:HIT family protein n=1 Tax=Acinetobacter baretiae TaxID=2605383 RepID=UPI0018C20149|nr:HIT family protein [Acinetobacter baretiae]MBF7682734.1 HIT family protein [Acinetobacter baretiae]
MAYDQNNIFAKILRQEIPCITVYEDEYTLAFMDIMPQATGHTLVIPKYQAVTLLDLPASELTYTMHTVQKVAHAIEKGLNAKGIVLMQLSGESAGQTVPHVHFHLIPSSVHDLKEHASNMADQTELKLLAEKIKAAF